MASRRQRSRRAVLRGAADGRVPPARRPGPAGARRPSDTDLASVEVAARPPAAPVATPSCCARSTASTCSTSRWSFAAWAPQAARSLIVANAGAPPSKLHPEELVIGETPTGDLFVLEPATPRCCDEPRVFRLSPDADERWLVGSSLPRWLAATVAHEQLLYGPDGEFLLEAFEEDGEELTPGYALRQAERALKKDEGSALYHYELGAGPPPAGPPAAGPGGVRRGGGPGSRPTPGPGSTSGRSERALGQMRQAAAAFECAAEASSGGQRGRFLAWSARSFFEAGDRTMAERAAGSGPRGSPHARRGAAPCGRGGHRGGRPGGPGSPAGRAGAGRPGHQRPARHPPAPGAARERTRRPACKSAGQAPAAAKAAAAAQAANTAEAEALRATQTVSRSDPVHRLRSRVNHAVTSLRSRKARRLTNVRHSPRTEQRKRGRRIVAAR